MVDHGKVILGLGLVVLGTLVTLAPVPMAAIRPDSMDEPAGEGEIDLVE
jgi:hypothetical protein